MIGVVLVGHGDLAPSMVRTVEAILGQRNAFTAVGLEPSDGLQEIQAKIEAAVQRVDGKEGVLVLTDMLGGSPSIAGLQAARQPERRGAPEGAGRVRIEIVAGMNLPAVLEALLHREEYPLEKLADVVVNKSRKGIIRATALRGLQR